MKTEIKEIVKITTSGGTVIVYDKDLEVPPLVVITEAGKILRTSTTTKLSPSKFDLVVNVFGTDEWSKVIEVFTEEEFCNMFEQTMAPAELHVIDRKLGASYIAESLCCVLSKEDALEVANILQLKILGDRD